MIRANVLYKKVHKAIRYNILCAESHHFSFCSLEPAGMLNLIWRPYFLVAKLCFLFNISKSGIFAIELVILQLCSLKQLTLLNL